MPGRVTVLFSRSFTGSAAHVAATRAHPTAHTGGGGGSPTRRASAYGLRRAALAGGVAVGKGFCSGEAPLPTDVGKYV